jgi:transcriptional accessory protein Tex/SPT6
VKVLEVDVLRKRIQLTMCLSDTPAPAAPRTAAPISHKAKNSSSNVSTETAMGSALLNALKGKV